MTVSPSNSPRLPSPPPMAEDQLGLPSPVAGSADHGKLNTFSEGASRRIRPGTKAVDMPEGPPLIPLTDIESPYQLTEHLKALYNDAMRPKGSSTVVPIDRATATRLATPPEGVDKYLWLYELCRFLCQEVNKMLVALFIGQCSAQTCNEMRASEWQYLCAVHDPPKPCCAIDYCCHTLDWAANVLTSPKNFPSRLSLQPETGSGHQQLRQLTNIFRRVYRIFAHAWFQHREMFWKVESKSGLYIFFKTVCDVYGLIPEDNYTVPSEAEGIESPSVVTRQTPTLLKRGEEENKKSENHPKEPANVATPTGHTTKRHRQTPSVDAGLITTVPEETEEEEEKDSKGQVSAAHLKRVVDDATLEPATADGEKTDGPAAQVETAVKPEHVEAVAETPAQTEAEEAVDSSAGEMAEPAAAIEPNELHVPSSVLTSESQSLVALQHETKHDSEESAEQEEVSELQEEKPQTSKTSETSQEPSNIPEPTAEREIPTKEEMDKTTETALPEPTDHEILLHDRAEDVKPISYPSSVAHGPTHPSGEGETLVAAAEPEVETPTKTEDMNERTKDTLKMEEVKETPSSGPDVEEEDKGIKPASDPNADAKGEEETTKSVED